MIKSALFLGYSRAMNINTRCANVSSRAFMVPSHNKKNIRLLSLFLVIFRPQCNDIVGVNMYAIRN